MYAPEVDFLKQKFSVGKEEKERKSPGLLYEVPMCKP